MTTQEKLNWVIKTIDKMRAQGTRAVAPGSETGHDSLNFACAYKTKDGLKCGVGIHIPDGLYDDAFEGRACHWVFAQAPDIALAMGAPEQRFLETGEYSAFVSFWNKMQSFHDTSKNDIDYGLRLATYRYELQAVIERQNRQDGVTV